MEWRNSSLSRRDEHGRHSRYKEAGLPHTQTSSRVHSFTPSHTHTTSKAASGTPIQIELTASQLTVDSLNPDLSTTPTTHQPPPSTLTMYLPNHLLLLTLLASLSLTAPLPQPHLQLRQTIGGATLPTTGATTMGSTTSETGSILEEGLNLATTLAPELIDLVKDFAG